MTEINRDEYYGNRAEIDHYNGETYNNVHKVQSAGELENLFPDVTDGTWSEQSELSDGDLVEIDGRYAPLRPTQDLRLETLTDVTIRGSAPIDIKPADGANAGKFVLTGNDSTPERVTFENVGYDGNKDNMTGGSTPFIVNWVCDNLVVRGCYATKNYPYHQHNAGGSAIINKSGGTGFRAFYNTFDDVGDRSIECTGCTDVVISGNRATNGFNRMVTLTGVTHATLMGNVSVDTVEGSAFGVTDTQGESRDILLVGNHGRGAIRNLFAFEGTGSNGGVNDVLAVCNTKKPDTSASTSNRNTFHQEGTGDNHAYLLNKGEDNTEAGYEIRFPNTRIDFAIEHSPDIGIQVVGGTGATDVQIGPHNRITNPATATFDINQPETYIGSREYLGSIGNTNSHRLNRGRPVNQTVTIRDKTNDRLATFLLNEGNVTEIADPGNHYGESSGSGNNYDIHWTGSQHQIENESGSSATFEVVYQELPRAFV